jgi:hypothetical protein
LEKLYLAFLVDDVFSCDRIVFLYFKLLRTLSLVLGRGIKVTRFFGRDQLDDIAHNSDRLFS